MQALEFEAVHTAGAFDNRGDSERIMRCKLRIDEWARGEHLFRTRHVVEIGHRLAGEDGIVIKPAFLRALHFRVPIGALHKTHHHATIIFLREVYDVVDDFGRALLIGLNGKPKPIPIGEGRISKHTINHIEGEFQPIRFFCIDGEVEIVRLRLLCECDDFRHKLFHHARMRECIIARMQCREFHRNTGAIGQRFIASSAADGIDRVSIRFEIALRVFVRACAFTQHVKGIAIEAALRRLRFRKRFFNGLAEHEMIAEDAHGLPRRSAHGG